MILPTSLHCPAHASGTLAPFYSVCSLLSSDLYLKSILEPVCYVFDLILFNRSDALSFSLRHDFCHPDPPQFLVSSGKTTDFRRLCCVKLSPQSWFTGWLLAQITDKALSDLLGSRRLRSWKCAVQRGAAAKISLARSLAASHPISMKTTFDSGRDE